MQCPRCSVPLAPGLPHTQICAQCEGVWVDKGALSQLVQASPEEIANSPLAGTLEANHQEVPLADLVPCPVCSATMTRYVYCADSGITLDRCPQHGIWFDDGELAQAMDYMQLGKVMGH